MWDYTVPWNRADVGDIPTVYCSASVRGRGVGGRTIAEERSVAPDAAYNPLRKSIRSAAARAAAAASSVATGLPTRHVAQPQVLNADRACRVCCPRGRARTSVAARREGCVHIYKCACAHACCTVATRGTHRPRVYLQNLRSQKALPTGPWRAEPRAVDN